MVFTSLPLLIAAALLLGLIALAPFPADTAVNLQVENQATEPILYYSDGRRYSIGLRLEPGEIIAHQWVMGPRPPRNQTVRVVEATNLQHRLVFCRSYTLDLLEAERSIVTVEPGRTEC